MLKKLTLLCLLATLAIPLALPLTAQAEPDGGYFPDGFDANTIGLEDTPLIEVIANLISIIMGLLGMIAVILMLYGGFIWMTAAGDDDKVKKAKNIIITATIGIIVIFAAWALATFAIDYLATGAITGSPSPGQ